MQKRVFLLLMAAVLLFGSAAAANAGDTRVFDYASLFSTVEANVLEEAIVDFQTATGYDFAILITDVDHGYDDYQLLCDDFYVDKSLGQGMNRTAIICYLDLYGDGYYYISVYGDLMYLMVEEDILYLANNALEYFYDGDFSGAFLWTMEMLTQALTDMGEMDAKRVYDHAELLTDAETETLEAAIADFRTLSGRDFLYLSTYDAMDGNVDGDYISEFYIMHGFGEGDERSGVAIYLDLDLGSYYIQNFGDMDDFVPQESIDVIVSNANQPMGEGKIAEAVLQVIDAYAAYFK